MRPVNKWKPLNMLTVAHKNMFDDLRDEHGDDEENMCGNGNDDDINQHAEDKNELNEVTLKEVKIGYSDENWDVVAEWEPCEALTDGHKGLPQGCTNGGGGRKAASAPSHACESAQASGVQARELINVLTRVAKESVNAAEELSQAGQWEEVEIIIDSGATVPVFPPRVGKLYAIQESEGSRNKDEYRVANGDKIPNLGEKILPVITEENTVRGITAQIADVTDPLQSVRHLNGSGHGVWLYGDDSFMINMVTGECNKITDNGKNFVTKVWVIPPSELNAVVGTATSGFPGPQK